jgi:NADPH-dependent 2,4-dienoyl-CoA reductase/sulfur reductase-like enzyme
VRTAENAEAVLAAGQADMVSIVRGQIADPELGNKARQGRPDDIRPCLSCNQMCWGRRYRDYWISCLVNPSAGREIERHPPSPRLRKVLVVGGGPAGLEAARVAAERGHRVTLAEAAPELGGRFRLAGLQPRRAQILDLIQWWEAQLAKLQVEIRRNMPLEPEDIAGFDADTVILATGSLPAGSGFQRALPHADRLPGVEAPNVWSLEDVMARRARPGRRVVLLDDLGHWHGAGTAWQLALHGHEVTIVTRYPMAAYELIRTATDCPLRQKLQTLGVRTLTDAAITAWHGDGAEVLDLRDGATQRLAADALVLATVNQSQTWLQEGLSADGLEVHAIGDCVAPRLAVMAIYEGRELALRL